MGIMRGGGRRVLQPSNFDFREITVLLSLLLSNVHEIYQGRGRACEQWIPVTLIQRLQHQKRALGQFVSSHPGQ
jgi:hypothetical protein